MDHKVHRHTVTSQEVFQIIRGKGKMTSAFPDTIIMAYKTIHIVQKFNAFRLLGILEKNGSIF